MPTTAKNPGAPPVLVVPRAWLVALTLLAVVPWLVVAAVYLRRGADAGGEPAGTAAVVSSAAANGRWGRLTVVPIVISPPIEFVSNDWGNWTDDADQWFFPGTPADVARAFLASTGLAAADVNQLLASAKPHPETRGLVITPDPGLVRRLDKGVRSRIYGELARTRFNVDQANSFRFHASSPSAWLEGSPISARTREIVEPLIYQSGEFLHFADVRTARSQITDAQELQRLGKTLLRQSTVVITLTVAAGSEVDGLAEYWGRGGRRTDIRPLLESLVDGASGHSIDIVHLLPAFARQLLYRYPKLSAADLDRPLLVNCLWTALNFFGDTPDARFLELNAALDALRKDYYVVESGFELGDVVAFVDRDGDLYHVAVHLAGEFVFTKNGTSPVSPWSIMTVAELKDYYRSIEQEPRIVYHRRRGM